MGKIIAVCSGCGGVGKSTIALSAALLAAKRNKRTILLDASGASRACDLMLGMESVVVLDLMDVLKQQTSIQSALYSIPGEEHLHFVCASLYDGTSINEFSPIILALRAMSDLLIIDLPTGPVRMGNDLLDKDDIILLLTRPDDVSIRSIERTLSLEASTDAQRMLVVNRANQVHIRKKQQYDAKSVEMMLDMPVSCFLYEDDSISFNINKAKRGVECSLRTKSELRKLLDQIL